jgi:hypothetical protein
MTTTPNFRALCADLLDCLEKANWPLRHKIIFELCVDSARAALTTPPPEPPTDDELDALEEKLWNEYKTIGYLGEEFMYDSSFGHALTDYRIALERWGQR